MQSRLQRNLLDFGSAGTVGKHKEVCSAFGKNCNQCNKKNHFAAKCRSKQMPRSVQTLAEDDEEDSQLGKTGIHNSQQVTVKLESGNNLRFQVDTGAQCNVIPLNVYRKATKDYFLQNIVLSQQKITAWSTIPVYGTVLLRVQRGNGHCKLNCKLVDRDDIRAILGRKA